MTRSFSQILFCLMAGIATICTGLPLAAQTTESAEKTVVAEVALPNVPPLNSSLPDAPLPQQAPATQTPASATPAAQAPASPTTPPSTDPAASSTAGPAAGAPQTAGTQAPAAQKSEEQIADEQLKVQKKQRIGGILPNFNASYISDAVPLTPKQKFKLMFSTEKDPATIGFSMFIALLGQAEGSHPAYGGGIGGYGKRFGQNYADTFDGAFWGNALLPSVLHQDPRYFRMGTGSAGRRIFYALSTNVRAKHDGTGKWEPNYSNLIGNLISGGISNIYLPANERGLGSTFEGAAVVTAEGGVGSMLEEFWPDAVAAIKRHRDKKNHPADVDKIAPTQPAASKPDAPAPQQQTGPQ
jgi:hypothetical protein